MRNKIIVLFLTLCLFSSMTVFSFGLSEPDKPTIDESNPTASNELIEQYNKQVDEYNVEVDNHNQQVDVDYEEAYSNYIEEKTKVEANNEFVENVENKIEADSSEARGFENSSTETTPTDWSDETDEDSLKTIQVEKSDNPSGKKIRVINIHLYLNDDSIYSPDVFDQLIEDDKFELSDSLKSRAVLTEWETAEIDYDDTVTLSSESKQFAGNIVWINGTRKWFGAAPQPYFFRNIEGYTQGYWMPGGSMTAETATETEYGWDAGETYSYRYAEKPVLSRYYENGQIKTEVVTTRTTDRQEPKNIFALFTYLFTRLAPEPEKQEMPIEPIKGEYLDKLEHLSLLEVPIPTIPDTPAPTSISNTDTDNSPIVVDAPTIVPTVAAAITETQPEPITIKEVATPQAAPEGAWALLNLILTIISCIIAIVLIFAKKKSENEEYTDEEKKDIRGIKRFKIYSILIGIISIIVFILTEDMTLPMILIDKWTILMAIFTIVEIINIFIIRHKSKEEDEDE